MTQFCFLVKLQIRFKKFPHRFVMKTYFNNYIFKKEVMSSLTIVLILPSLSSLLCAWPFQPMRGWLPSVCYFWYRFQMLECTGAGFLQFVRNFLWIAMHPWRFADESTHWAFWGAKLMWINSLKVVDGFLCTYYFFKTFSFWLISLAIFGGRQSFRQISKIWQEI